MSLIYLASPYTHTDPKVRQERYETVRDFVAYHLHHHGEPIYSPIVAWHGIAQEKSLPYHADFWHRQNIAMLRRCDMFWGMKIDGWEESAGCKMELDFAKNLHIQVHFIDEHGDFIL